MPRPEITYVNNSAFVTAANASRYLELSRARISQLVNKGTFESIEIGSNVLIPLVQVEAYKATKRKPGRKPKTDYDIKNDDISIKEV